VLLVTVAVFLAWWYRSATPPRRVVLTGAAVLIVLAAARFAIHRAGEPVGWLARYYANETFSGSAEWSLGRPQRDATRIDRVIRFQGDTFPAYFLNDARYVPTRGGGREVRDPFSVQWTGFVFADTTRVVPLALAATGDARVSIDGREILNVDSSSGERASATVSLAPGRHACAVSYRKPAGVRGFVEFNPVAGSSSDPLTITWKPTTSAASRIPGTLARSVDVAVFLVVALVLVLAERSVPSSSSLRHAFTSDEAASRAVAGLLFLLFGVEGWLLSRQHIAHLVTLSGGDDWLMYEANARDILQHGLLMTFGLPLGEGQPFFIYPFYSYVMAAVHALTGEGLFGVIFAQFLVLAGVAYIVWHIAATVFDRVSALVGLATLVAVMHIDLARYYTVTLLSENLYVLTVTLMLAAFVRWIVRGGAIDLWLIGIWGGVSAITRPSMLSYGIPALSLIAVISWARRRDARSAVAAAAATAGGFVLAVAPITLRNWLVSGRWVLITEGQTHAFIAMNAASPSDSARYFQQFPSESLLSVPRTLWQIASDHPLAFITLQLKKLGFSLGMVHWIPAYRPHPELVVISIAYFGLLALSKSMRTPALWPIHLFVLSHLASLALTQPWTYGYRLIMPPFIYTSALSATVLAASRTARIPRP
jgi:hypothetical protein